MSLFERAHAEAVYRDAPSMLKPFGWGQGKDVMTHDLTEEEETEVIALRMVCDQVYMMWKGGLFSAEPLGLTSERLQELVATGFLPRTDTQFIESDFDEFKYACVEREQDIFAAVAARARATQGVGGGSLPPLKSIGPSDGDDDRQGGGGGSGVTSPRAKDYKRVTRSGLPVEADTMETNAKHGDATKLVKALLREKEEGHAVDPDIDEISRIPLARTGDRYFPWFDTNTDGSFLCRYYVRAATGPRRGQLLRRILWFLASQIATASGAGSLLLIVLQVVEVTFTDAALQALQSGSGSASAKGAFDLFAKKGGAAIANRIAKDGTVANTWVKARDMAIEHLSPGEERRSAFVGGPVDLKEDDINKVAFKFMISEITNISGEWDKSAAAGFPGADVRERAVQTISKRIPAFADIAPKVRAQTITEIGEGAANDWLPDFARADAVLAVDGIKNDVIGYLRILEDYSPPEGNNRSVYAAARRGFQYARDFLGTFSLSSIERLIAAWKISSFAFSFHNLRSRATTATIIAYGEMMIGKSTTNNSLLHFVNSDGNAMATVYVYDAAAPVERKRQAGVDFRHLILCRAYIVAVRKLLLGMPINEAPAFARPSGGTFSKRNFASFKSQGALKEENETFKEIRFKKAALDIQDAVLQLQEMNRRLRPDGESGYYGGDLKEPRSGAIATAAWRLGVTWVPSDEQGEPQRGGQRQLPARFIVDSVAFPDTNARIAESECPPLMQANDVKVLKTVENGDCFYDSIAKIGISKNLAGSWTAQGVRAEVARFFTGPVPTTGSIALQLYNSISDGLHVAVQSTTDYREMIAQSERSKQAAPNPASYVSLQEASDAFADNNARPRRKSLMEAFGKEVAKAGTWANEAEVAACAIVLRANVGVYMRQTDNPGTFIRNIEHTGPGPIVARFAVEHVFSDEVGEGIHYMGMLLLAPIAPGQRTRPEDDRDPYARRRQRTAASLTDAVIDRFLAMRAVSKMAL